MRVLYESLFFDATSHRDERGPGHVMYRVLRDSDVDLECLGPPTPPAWRLEELVRLVHRRVTGRRYLRFPWSQCRRAGALLEAAVRETQPDVGLTMFPASLGGSRRRGRLDVPMVYRVDATYEGTMRAYPEYGYGPVMRAAARRLQHRAFGRSSLVVTHSEWCRNSLMEDHCVPEDKIRVFANAAGLPSSAVPDAWHEGSVDLHSPLELLFVGGDGHRKGLTVAREVVERLNHGGLHSRLTVCGIRVPDSEFVRYLGPFDKDTPDDLQRYVRLFEKAHLLIHPTRFDTWAMVTSEAAAFGVPTVTNGVAGMPSSVTDGVSGLVLPSGSPPAAYADAIRRLLAEPEQYAALARGARKRYESEFSWTSFGHNLLAVLREAAALGKSCT